MIDPENLDLEHQWEILLTKLVPVFGKKPADLDTVLFLIGVQELGKGKRNFSKEEKQDLMHIAICRVLSSSGYYELEGLDPEGWPHWKAIKKVPNLPLKDQEKFLKVHVLEYFEKELEI
jgi:hypothetical protein